MKTKEQMLFDFFLWRTMPGTHFSHKLYDLFMKADPCNKRRLEIAFPMEGDIFKEWCESRSEAAFFEANNLGDKWGNRYASREANNETL